MYKDKFLRLLFIPLLGIGIPYVSGVIDYKRYSVAELAAVHLYFIFVSFCIWRGCHLLHLRIRRRYPIDLNPMKKVGTIAVATAGFAGIVSALLCMLWMKFSNDRILIAPLFRFIVFSIMAALLFGLVYEVIFLSTERVRDNRIVDQLDNELNRAEMRALRNELDPHFIFNSLNTLSYLIGKNDEKAQQFNNKLAHVYKYFLVNKDKELIPVDREIDFIGDYFFLLQIRYDNTMQLQLDLDDNAARNMQIIPCSVQLLIENAIKHTVFTHEDPLRISVWMDKNYLGVENSFSYTNDSPGSTRVGLKNLNAQYQLVLKKSIIVERFEKKFLVRLPLYKNAMAI